MDNTPEVPGLLWGGLFHGDKHPSLNPAMFAAGSYQLLPSVHAGSRACITPHPYCSPRAGELLVPSSRDCDAVLWLHRAPATAFDSKPHGHYNVPNLIFCLFKNDIALGM